MGVPLHPVTLLVVGIAGEGRTVIDKVDDAPLQFAFEPKTEIFPVVTLFVNATVICDVPCPIVIVAPAGTDHV